MLIASTVKEVEGDFFCRSSHRSLFVLVCVILFRWNEEVKVSHLWVFITCQRNVSRHWRSHEMKSCLLQTTNWGEEEKNWDTLSSLQNITNTHFLFCPDHYSFRLTWRYKTLLNHTTSWGDVQFLATILVFFQSFFIDVCGSFPDEGVEICSSSKWCKHRILFKFIWRASNSQIQSWCVFLGPP